MPIILTEEDATALANPPAGTSALLVDDSTHEYAQKAPDGTVSPLAGAAGTPGADGADGADAPPLTYLDKGATGSTETVDFTAGDIQRLVANAATVTLSYTGIPATGTPALVQLWLEQDGSGGRVWAFPAATDWGDFGEPDWASRGAGHVDLVSLEVVDGGAQVLAGLQGRPGDTGAAGANGVDGTVGGAIAIDYTFSTTTTDSDPGAGALRLSNATQASAVTIRADLLDSHGTDWTAVLNTLADASNTVKGHIRLFVKADPTKWLVYTVAAVATPSGYRNITVANVGASGANPLSNGDPITLAFTRAGDQGSTVGSGTLTTVEEVDGSPTDSAVTKLVFPNGTLGIASHVATYTPARTSLPSATASVATRQTLTGNNAYVDLATAGPAVTVTVNTACLVILTADTDTATGGYGAMGVVLSGANTLAAANAKALFVGTDAADIDIRASVMIPLTGLTPGSTTFTAKYSQLGGPGATAWSIRDITVICLD